MDKAVDCSKTRREAASPSAFKKPSIRLVWVKSDKKSEDKKENEETIGETESKHPIVELLTGSSEPNQGMEPIRRSRYKNSGARSSAAAGRSVWVERPKMLLELSQNPRMEPVKDLLEGPPSSSSSDYGKESPERNSGKKKGKLSVYEILEQWVDGPPPSSSSSDSGNYGQESPERTRWKKKGKLQVYKIPKHLMEMIEMDKVPEVLTMPLTPSTYADYFAALLYAEDFYIEKWNNFLLYRVHLEIDEKQMKKEREKRNMISSNEEGGKVYLSFEVTSIPMRRPYLLSRDFVFLRRSGKKSKHFEGRLIRVVKSTHVLVEFGDDFRSQYSPTHKYDVSFSFNRTCLKRAHQAVEAALDSSFQDILFPSLSLLSPCPATPSAQDLDQDQASVVQRVLSHRGPPYLIKGPPAVTKQKVLSAVGKTVVEAVLHIYRNSPSCCILVISPKNLTCDLIIKCLNKIIPDSELFRANAAFREIEDVPDDIWPLCSYDGECFSDLSLSDLQAFKVIISTFITSFRLHSNGISAGHFTHIFLVDASSATEPETMVPLANLAGDETSIVITGSLRNHPDRVRSDIARRNGLKRSYFHRLLESEPYSSDHPDFVSQLRQA